MEINVATAVFQVTTNWDDSLQVGEGDVKIWIYKIHTQDAGSSPGWHDDFWFGNQPPAWHYICRFGNPNINLHLPLLSWVGGKIQVQIVKPISKIQVRWKFETNFPPPQEGELSICFYLGKMDGSFWKAVLVVFSLRPHVPCSTAKVYLAESTKQSSQKLQNIPGGIWIFLSKWITDMGFS